MQQPFSNFMAQAGRTLVTYETNKAIKIMYDCPSIFIGQTYDLREFNALHIHYLCIDNRAHRLNSKAKIINVTDISINTGFGGSTLKAIQGPSFKFGPPPEWVKESGIKSK